MLIWDLCGGSGAWSAPYREAGYCVEVYDLTRGHDVRLLRRTRAGVWGILAAPMCTKFSYARNRYPPTDAELLEALSLVDACIRVAYAQRNGLKWWARAIQVLTLVLVILYVLTRVVSIPNVLR
jgi:hypothetical protein